VASSRGPTPRRGLRRRGHGRGVGPAPRMSAQNPRGRRVLPAYGRGDPAACPQRTVRGPRRARSRGLPLVSPTSLHGPQQVCSPLVPRRRSPRRPRLAKTCCFCRDFLRSGRQDLNLRPPGPQSEGCGGAQLLTPVSVGSTASELLCVALKLDPKLDPKHLFSPPAWQRWERAKPLLALARRVGEQLRWRRLSKPPASIRRPPVNWRRQARSRGRSCKRR
jgi:hypothetical protein